MRERDHAVIERVEDAPLVSADALLGGRPVLVLSPHPDDESLGCGALLATAFRGPGAHVACLTDGSASHPQSRSVPPPQLALLRRAELHQALARLGGADQDVTWIGAPDGALQVRDDLIETLAGLACAGRFGLILAPSPLDAHCDHETGAEIGRRLQARVPGTRLGYYPIWSRWHGKGQAPRPAGTTAVRFAPGWAATAKVAAIAAHRSQAGLVVHDAPDGFEMPPGFADFFAREDEVFSLAEKDNR